MRNRFLGFVAHVGEAKGLAFDFAVAGIDDEVVFFAEIPGEFGNVDAAGVFHASQRFRAVTIFGEEIEAAVPDPIVDEGVGPGVAPVTIR